MPRRYCLVLWAVAVDSRPAMSTMQLLLLAAIGVSLVVSFVMKMPSASRRGARKLLAETPWLSDDSPDGSPVKVTGVVKMREHGERFVSPITETRCVVLRTRVLVRHGRDPRAKLVEDFKIKPFLIETEDGKLLVDSEHALLDIAPAKQSRKINPRKNQFLSELGFKDANSAQSEFEETLVEVGASVTVAGSLAKQLPRAEDAVGYRETDAPRRIVGVKDHPIAIRLERRGDVSNEP